MPKLKRIVHADVKSFFKILRKVEDFDKLMNVEKFAKPFSMQVRFSIAKIRQEGRIMQILVCENCAKSVRMLQFSYIQWINLSISFKFTPSPNKVSRSCLRWYETVPFSLDSSMQLWEGVIPHLINIMSLRFLTEILSSQSMRNVSVKEG